MKTRLLTLVLALIAAAPLAAQAQQHLIPAPYPSGNESGRILANPPSYRHQQLLPTPFPNNLGPNALGNPRISKTRRHQRLLRTPYPRLYR
jgi:hypothetical protein